MKSALLPSQYHSDSRRILRGIPPGCSSVTMIPPSKTRPSPGKPSPSRQVCAVSFESLHCVHGKKTGHFCSQFCREKSIFACMIGARRFFWLCHFSFKRVQQWPLVPTARIVSCFSTNDCVHCKKTGHFCSQICREKSIFESMIGARRFVGCSFSLQTSTTMAIHAYDKDCLLL